MFQEMQDLPPNVLGITASGVITSSDYTDVLEPLVDSRIKASGKLHIIFHIDSHFERFDAGAMVSDTRFGIRHWGDLEKIALVTDIEWLRGFAHMFSPLMRGTMRIFAEKELDKAKAWVSEA